MDFENIFILAQKELRDARKNRWFLLYTLAFAGLSLALAWLALSGAGNYGLAGFGRTSASLINLILLIVPLMGLTLGALSLAGELLGLVLALIAALSLGFGLTGIVIAANGGRAELSTYLTLLALSIMLAVAALSLGFLISAAVWRGATS